MTRARAKQKPPRTVSVAASLLGPLPVLPRALCKGQHEKFDPGLPDYTAAEAMCKICPELAACSKWAGENPKKVVGYVGGQLILHKADAKLAEVKSTGRRPGRR